MDSCGCASQRVFPQRGVSDSAQRQARERCSFDSGPSWRERREPTRWRAVRNTRAPVRQSCGRERVVPCLADAIVVSVQKNRVQISVIPTRGSEWAHTSGASIWAAAVHYRETHAKRLGVLRRRKGTMLSAAAACAAALSVSGVYPRVQGLTQDAGRRSLANAIRPVARQTQSCRHSVVAPL